MGDETDNSDVNIDTALFQSHKMRRHLRWVASALAVLILGWGGLAYRHSERIDLSTNGFVVVKSDLRKRIRQMEYFDEVGNRQLSASFNYTRQTMTRARFFDAENKLDAERFDWTLLGKRLEPKSPIVEAALH